MPERKESIFSSFRLKVDYIYSENCPFLATFRSGFKFFTMEIPFIGREKEKETLLEALQSPEAEMVAVVGRRRVGKTFLIKKVYEKQIIFSIKFFIDV